MRHSLKNTRYRICFQTKNKVWIYKNSRLRNFYKIRNRVVLDSSKFGKNFLVTKNMKWTVARRQMVPYFRSKSRFYFFYKNLFFTKQRLKAFYGGLKEYQIRNIFKTTWNKEHNFRTNIFLGALEQRLGMVLFRMRLLPTIYACNQLVRHHGILVNDSLISLPSFRVKLGDFVSIPEDYWFTFYVFIFERIRHRFWGHSLLLWRKEFYLRKIEFYSIRKKDFYIANFRFYDKFAIRKSYFIEKLNLIYKIIVKLNSKNKQSVDLKILQFIFVKFYQTLNPILNTVEKNLSKLHWWSRDYYPVAVKTILMHIYYLDVLLYKYDLLLLKYLLRRRYSILEEVEQRFGKTFPAHAELCEMMTDLLHTTEELYMDDFFGDEDNPKRILYSVQRGLKKTWNFKNKFLRYKRFFIYLLRKLKYRKLKKQTFKNFCKKHHWYTPSYMEIDYLTLRACFIDYPKMNQTHFGFLCSFKKIVSFYKERAL